jgi:hypothetical protein
MMRASDTRVRERVRGALVRITTQSERTMQFQATTRSELGMKFDWRLLRKDGRFYKKTGIKKNPTNMILLGVVFVDVRSKRLPCNFIS